MQQSLKHFALITWKGVGDQPYVHVVSTVVSEEMALKYGQHWIDNHPQPCSLGDAKVIYLGKGPF